MKLIDLIVALALTALCVSPVFVAHAYACDDERIITDEGISYPATVETDCEVEVFDIDDIVYTFIDYHDGQCWYVD
jgi:hypothetical protein